MPVMTICCFDQPSPHSLVFRKQHLHFLWGKTSPPPLPVHLVQLGLNRHPSPYPFPTQMGGGGLWQARLSHSCRKGSFQEVPAGLGLVLFGSRAHLCPQSLRQGMHGAVRLDALGWQATFLL